MTWTLQPSGGGEEPIDNNTGINKILSALISTKSSYFLPGACPWSKHWKKNNHSEFMLCSVPAGNLDAWYNHVQPWSLNAPLFSCLTTRKLGFPFSTWTPHQCFHYNNHQLITRTSLRTGGGGQRTLHLSSWGRTKVRRSSSDPVSLLFLVSREQKLGCVSISSK